MKTKIQVLSGGIALILLFIPSIFLIRSCEKDFYFIQKIKIKGEIPATLKKSASNSSESFTLSDAGKVLIFYGRDYDLVNINSDGTFAGRAPLGSATAIAFLTDSYEFIGNLFIGSINFLPLVGVENDVTIIDFSTLSMQENKIIPSNNPLGNEIVLSPDEIRFMEDVGSYYTSLSQNIDMNNDGTPDIMQNALIEINTSQNLFAGKWGQNEEDPELLPIDQIFFDYSIHIVGPNELLNSTENSLAENATLGGPAINPLSNIQNTGNSYINNKEFKLNFGIQNNGKTEPFPEGVYTLSIDNKQYSFSYTNIDMLNAWVAVIPRFITNSEEEITNIELEYRFLNGVEVDPRKLFKTGIQVQLNGSDYNQLLEIRSSESSPTDPAYNYYNIVLDQVFKLSEISGISLIYTDLFGNEASCSWQSQMNWQ